MFVNWSILSCMFIGNLTRTTIAKKWLYIIRLLYLLKANPQLYKQFNAIFGLAFPRLPKIFSGEYCSKQHARLWRGPTDFSVYLLRRKVRKILVHISKLPKNMTHSQFCVPPIIQSCCTDKFRLSIKIITRMASCHINV